MKYINEKDFSLPSQLIEVKNYLIVKIKLGYKTRPNIHFEKWIKNNIFVL
jgi:hypothetical protein